jgi:hypothetical protein
MTSKNLLSKKSAGGEKLADRSIVDILTSDDSRTSVFAPKKEGKVLQSIIGVNSVSQGAPVRIRGKYDERGFVDPEDSRVIYFIDAKCKKIRACPNEMNLFYDADKVNSENQYVWNGTTQEMLDEFKKSGYEIFDISFPLREYGDLVKQVGDAVNGKNRSNLYTAENAVNSFFWVSCGFVPERARAYDKMLKVLSGKIENKFDETGW